MSEDQLWEYKEIHNSLELLDRLSVEFENNNQWDTVKTLQTIKKNLDDFLRSKTSK